MVRHHPQHARTVFRGGLRPSVHRADDAYRRDDLNAHRIEWDHGDCDHADDPDGGGYCSPSGRVTCEEEDPVPLRGHCRVVCADTSGACEDGYLACPGNCDQLVADAEYELCTCCCDGHSPGCAVLTHPIPPHPDLPHCIYGHPLRYAEQCQAELFLNEDGELLAEMDLDGRYEDAPVRVIWTGGGYEWEYTNA